MRLSGFGQDSTTTPVKHGCPESDGAAIWKPVAENSLADNSFRLAVKRSCQVNAAPVLRRFVG